LLSIALVLMASTPAAAQDEELQALLLLAKSGVAADGAQASSLQVYRLPLDYALREPRQGRWGMRLSFPVSLGAYTVEGSTAAGSLSERFENLTVTPGVELQVRAGRWWFVKPFGEIGVTVSRSGSTALTYGAGVRARSDRDLGSTHLRLGGAARYASPRSNRAELADYTTIELGCDTQVPLGFRIGERSTWGGVYAIARYFPDLEGPAAAFFDVGRLYEIGVSFSTRPIPKLWIIEFPWIAVGYRFGGPFSGVRVSFSFPF
jgi:hypothetical protein